MPHSLILNLQEFCLRSERREGVLGAPELTRVAAESRIVDEFRWRAEGGLLARQEAPAYAGRPTLSVTLIGRLIVPCARCLAPLEIDLCVARRYIGFDTEAEADEALLDDDVFDAIVVSRAFDLGELMEDEILMAIPLTVQHDVCPPAALAALGLSNENGQSVRHAAKENPFEALRTLKKKR